MNDPSKHSTASYKSPQSEEVKQNVANFYKQLAEQKEKEKQTNQ